MGLFKKSKEVKAKKVEKSSTNKKTEIKKSIVKDKPLTKVSAATKKQPTNVYYITTRFENNKKVGWEIKRGNAAKVSAFVSTKEEAKTKVKVLAKNSKASVIIYRVDGTVEETYKINE